MYVTRSLSLYKNIPLLSLPPVEGPGSGYLIIEDVEDKEYVPSSYSPGGLMLNKSLKDLPFPQNKLLTVRYNSGDEAYSVDAFFVPVIDQPLSSNRYYVMVAENKNKGLAYASATEEDRQPRCFCSSYISDKKPKELNPYNISQKFEIIKTRNGYFSARSVNPDGIPPTFLRKQGWRIRASELKSFTIGEAEGLNSTLRSQLPSFDFPVSHEYTQPVSVGTWYCPYMFVVEGNPKEQMERSIFYEMKLEQRWERIYACERGDVKGEGNTVAVNVVVPTELVQITWTDAVSERDEAKGIMWFWIVSKTGLQTRVGLNLVIVKRMMWEQERVGWVFGDKKQMTVARMEKYGGGDSWKKFGCYMLVEQFVLKRLDGSLVLTYEFKHTHRIRCKWE